MAPEPSTRATYEDLLRMPDDGRHYEIIHGELLVNAAPVPRHQIVSMNLAFIIRSHLERQPSGIVLTSPIDVVLDDDEVLGPDIIFIRNERKNLITEKNVSGAPDLVIEILSESTRKRDEITKRKLYEQYGVGEYWIVDPVLESVKIYRATGGRYERVAEVSTEAGNASVTTPLFPDLEINVARVFAS